MFDRAQSYPKRKPAMPLQKVSSQRRALSLLNIPLPSCRPCCAVVLLLAWPARRRGASSARHRSNLVLTYYMTRHDAVLHGQAVTTISCIICPAAEAQNRPHRLELCMLLEGQLRKPSWRYKRTNNRGRKDCRDSEIPEAPSVYVSIGRKLIMCSKNVLCATSLCCKTQDQQERLKGWRSSVNCAYHRPIADGLAAWQGH